MTDYNIPAPFLIIMISLLLKNLTNKCQTNTIIIVIGLQTMSPVGPLPANLCILPNLTRMICFHCTDSTTFSCPLFRLAVMSNGLYVQHNYDCICDLLAKMVIFWLPLVSRPPPPPRIEGSAQLSPNLFFLRCSFAA